MFRKKYESLVALDVGTSSVKLVELNLDTETPSLVNIGSIRIPPGTFSGSAISNTDVVADKIVKLLEEHVLVDRMVVTAMPGPSVFTKKITVPYTKIKDIHRNIQFEAANLIPHQIEDVKLDYHIVRQSEEGTSDLIVVAVKNEIVDSFLETFEKAGIQLGIIDVDYFALQNAYELAYPQLFEKTVALIDVGDRYTTVNICKEGDSLFAGNISIGSRGLTEDIIEAFDVDEREADKIKRGLDSDDPRAEELTQVIESNNNEFAEELNRQLSFFWSAAGGSESGIDAVLLCGGGQRKGLIGSLSEETGVPCELFNPLKGIDCGDKLSSDEIAVQGPRMAVGIGLALREAGDKFIDWM